MPTTNRWLASLNKTIRRKKLRNKPLKEILAIAKKEYRTSLKKNPKKSPKKKAAPKKKSLKQRVKKMVKSVKDKIKSATMKKKPKKKKPKKKSLKQRVKKMVKSVKDKIKSATMKKKTKRSRKARGLIDDFKKLCTDGICNPPTPMQPPTIKGLAEARIRKKQQQSEPVNKMIEYNNATRDVNEAKGNRQLIKELHDEVNNN